MDQINYWLVPLSDYAACVDDFDSYIQSKHPPFEEMMVPSGVMREYDDSVFNDEDLVQLCYELWEYQRWEDIKVVATLACATNGTHAVVIRSV